jgi:hypothetical protein
MKLMVRTAFIALTLLADCTTYSQQPMAVRPESPTVPLCELLKSPSTYSGRVVTTTARIASEEHFTDIWDPACPYLGTVVHFLELEHSPAAVSKLLREINKGMGHHPIIATMTGTWTPNQTTENAMFRQPQTVFLVSNAVNIHRSKKAEHR